MLLTSTNKALRLIHIMNFYMFLLILLFATFLLYNIILILISKLSTFILYKFGNIWLSFDRALMVAIFGFSKCCFNSFVFDFLFIWYYIHLILLFKGFPYYWMVCFGLVLMELLFFKSTITLEIDKFLLFSNQGNAATLQITSTEKFIHLKGGTMFKPFS